MTDKNKSVEYAATRALHETDFDLSKAYTLAVEYFEKSVEYIAGANMCERIYREVDLQFENKDVIVEVKKPLRQSKVDAYLRSKGE